MKTERDARLERWLTALIATPGLTAIRDFESAWRELAVDSLEARSLVERFEGPIADVGSGGGAPGIPLASVFPERRVALIEAHHRRCSFLERFMGEFGNLEVVCGRAEEQPIEEFGVVVAKALAPPAVALEWCLPLAREGGAVILYCGALEGDLTPIARMLGGGEPELHEVAGKLARTLVVVPKIGPTPEGFPRRSGVARKRPLG
jgi:16S rRNA (guanine527-N7)-methyltransferase